MKTSNIQILAKTFNAWVLFLMIIPSCQNCDLLDQDIVFPPKSCSGTFYFLKADSAMDTNFTLNSMAKPVFNPPAATFIAGPFGMGTNPFSIRSNFSSFDSIGNSYVFQHFYGGGSRFFSFELGTASQALISGPPIDVCPVFHRPSKRLYSIFIENVSGNEWLYNIVEINPVNGQDALAITGNSITTNSQLNPEYMSSASTYGDLIYFLSNTNLIEVNLNTNTSRHIDIDPTFNAIDNPVTYLGLEYDRTRDQLLCLKNGPDLGGVHRTMLMSITVSPSGAQLTTLFDITNQLPTSHQPQINPDFYSTAFNACDTTYYITELNNINPFMTNFITISLGRSSLTSQVVEGYWYGLEIRNE